MEALLKVKELAGLSRALTAERGRTAKTETVARLLAGARSDEVALHRQRGEGQR